MRSGNDLVKENEPVSSVAKYYLEQERKMKESPFSVLTVSDPLGEYKCLSVMHFNFLNEIYAEREKAWEDGTINELRQRVWVAVGYDDAR